MVKQSIKEQQGTLTGGQSFAARYKWNLKSYCVNWVQ